MNGKELIETLSGSTDISRSEAKRVFELVFDTMADSLVSGDRIEIRGFGSFRIKKYKAYDGRNPKTGEVIRVASKKLPFFKAGEKLKKRVDYKNGEG